MTSTLSIGRKGKALRRRNQRRYAESQLLLEGKTCHARQSFPAVELAESKTGIGNPFSVYLLTPKKGDLKQWDNLLIFCILLANEYFNRVSSMDMLRVVIFDYFINLS